MRGSAALATTEEPADGPSATSGTTPGRVHALVTAHLSFVWRSLVRLGVPRADAEDAMQQVFIVAADRIDDIEVGRERAFLFGTAMRIASRARRTQQRRHEVLDAEPEDRIDPRAGAEELLDRARARAELDAILDGMPLELRAVFVLFELEQTTMAEIALLLDLPPGTVASRLRRARDHFQAAARRLTAKGGHA
ncbi:RNA polymerase sigma factor RpoE [Minicystis rosea]|nr:RNA polymerase sigma factor RpoE [Minicystis rosea]